MRAGSLSRLLGQQTQQRLLDTKKALSFVNLRTNLMNAANNNGAPDK